jgi:hypothetical protein
MVRELGARLTGDCGRGQGSSGEVSIGEGQVGRGRSLWVGGKNSLTYAHMGM